MSETSVKAETNTINPEKAITSAQRLFEGVPLIDKASVMKDDWLLMLGGLKAVTDFSYLGDMYDEAGHEQFKAAAEQEGLRVSSMDLYHPGGGDIPRRRGYVYDPQILARQTAAANLAPAYDVSEDIHEWIKRCQDAGASVGTICGLMYSFPPSAIQDHSNRTERPIVKRAFQFLENQGLLQTQSIVSGHETYSTYNPTAPDIIERESAKAGLLGAVHADERYLAIVSSQAMQDSQDELAKRSPARQRQLVNNGQSS